MSEDIQAQRADLVRYLAEQTTVLAALLGILRPPINVAAEGNLSVAVENMRHAADVLMERGGLNEAENLALYAVENWITAAILAHARSYHGMPKILRQSRFHAVVSFELAGRCLVALGGQLPPGAK